MLIPSSFPQREHRRDSLHTRRFLDLPSRLQDLNISTDFFTILDPFFTVSTTSRDRLVDTLEEHSSAAEWFLVTLDVFDPKEINDQAQAARLHILLCHLSKVICDELGLVGSMTAVTLKDF